MDGTVQEMLTGLANACPHVTARDYDWERLYQITLYVHRQGLNIEHRAIRDYLIQRGCSIQKATWLSWQYRHLSKLLTLYDEQKAS